MNNRSKTASLFTVPYLSEITSPRFLCTTTNTNPLNTSSATPTKMEDEFGFSDQYRSLENAMRTRFESDFPDRPMGEFDKVFLSCRREIESIGRKSGYTSDEHRWWAEKLTWEAFCRCFSEAVKTRGINSIAGHRDPFPGIRPPPTFGRAGLYSPRGYHQRHSRHRGRIDRRAGSRSSHQFREANNGTLSSRGRVCGGSGRNRSGSASNHFSFNSSQINYHLPLPVIEQSPLFSFQEETPSLDSSSLVTINTPDTTSTAENTTANNIICLQCGVTGHPEISCPYQINIKQRIDSERYLICGTLGHSAFKFGSSDGCTDCKKDKEQEAELRTRSEGNVKVATRDEYQSADGTGSPAASDVAYNSGWEEPNYHEIVQKNKFGSPDRSVQMVTSAFRSHNIDGHMEVEFEKDETAESAVYAGFAEDDEEDLIQL